MVLFSAVAVTVVIMIAASGGLQKQSVAPSLAPSMAPTLATITAIASFAATNQTRLRRNKKE